MKKDSRVLLSAAIALLVLSGCNKTATEDGHKPLPPPPNTPVTITLDVDAENPDFGPDQKLDFFLPTAKPHDHYWVRFPNRNPCDASPVGDGKTYIGTYEVHATCKTKAGTHKKYLYTWAPGDPPAPFQNIILFDVIKCKPSCD